MTETPKCTDCGMSADHPFHRDPHYVHAHTFAPRSAPQALASEARPGKAFDHSDPALAPVWVAQGGPCICADCEAKRQAPASEAEPTTPTMQCTGCGKTVAMEPASTAYAVPHFCPRCGHDLWAATVTFKPAITLASESASTEICEWCAGGGKVSVSGYPPFVCGRCEGSGRVPALPAASPQTAKIEDLPTDTETFNRAVGKTPAGCQNSQILPPSPSVLETSQPARAGTREAPTNAQQEPGYPEHDTVCASIRFPMMTAHLPSERCAIQEPHQTAECGEFASRRSPVDGEARTHMVVMVRDAVSAPELFVGDHATALAVYEKWATAWTCVLLGTVVIDDANVVECGEAHAGFTREMQTLRDNHATLTSRLVTLEAQREAAVDEVMMLRNENMRVEAERIRLEAQREALTEYVKAVRSAGAQLANCAYNLAQSDVLTERHKRSLREGYARWDAIPPALAPTGEPSDG